MNRRGFSYVIVAAALVLVLVGLLWQWVSGASPFIALATAFVAALAALATLLHNWNGGRVTRIELTGGKTLNDAADKLAESLKKERKAVEHRFRIGDPYALPVPWTAAPSDLVDDLQMQREVAEGFPGFTGGEATQWLSTHAELDGRGNDLTNLLSRCPAKRLLVLGEAGAGKTILLSRLQWDLLEKRKEGEPVPVIFPLGDWSPGIQSIESWMAGRLMRDYRVTRYPHDEPEGRSTKAMALLNAGLVMPILDGFDEIPSEHRYGALETINRSFSMGEPLVMSSQTEGFRGALSAGSGAEVRLNGAAGIEMRPIPADDARSYLLRDAGGATTKSAERWKTVVDLLGTSTPVGEALRTSLYLFLCRTIYNARPVGNLDIVPAPNELCDPVRFPSAETVKEHLSHAYIPAVYQAEVSSSVNTKKKMIPPEKALRAHRAIAQHVSKTTGGSREFRWWNFHRVSSRTANAISLALGGLSFLLLFLPARNVETGSTVAISAFFGLMTYASVRGALKSSRRDLTSGLRWKWRVYPTIFGAGSGYGILAMRYAAAEGYPPDGIFETHVHPTLTMSIAWALCGAAISVSTCGWVPRIIEESQPIGPLESLRVDRKTFVKVFIAWFGSSTVLITLVLGILMYNPPVPNIDTTTWIMAGTAISAISGSFIGIWVGLFMAFKDTAWGLFLITRLARALLTGTPLRLMSFLEDAHRLGVLRKVGPAYRFRHAEIHKSLLQGGVNRKSQG
ncbi:NACHT domain-containing NTPase [Streptomyces sp. cg2]|uniref:NACHT domain-containing protein n=1 Tax=Streptomyces sp. cg2 TaxID=3238799 RepID=UPI0034E2A472